MSKEEEPHNESKKGKDASRLFTPQVVISNGQVNKEKKETNKSKPE